MNEETQKKIEDDTADEAGVGFNEGWGTTSNEERENAYKMLAEMFPAPHLKKNEG